MTMQMSDKTIADKMLGFAADCILKVVLTRQMKVQMHAFEGESRLDSVAVFVVKGMDQIDAVIKLLGSQGFNESLTTEDL